MLKKAPGCDRVVAAHMPESEAVIMGYVEGYDWRDALDNWRNGKRSNTTKHTCKECGHVTWKQSF